jgi:YVTN family beta-propeller protein
MPRRTVLTAAVVAALLALSGVVAIASTRLVAGPQSDGTGVTPNGWLVTPAGRQVDLADQVYWADRPDGQALSPDGRTLLISSGGQSVDSLKVVDTGSGRVVQTIAYPAPEALFVGVAWSPDGRRAYAAAGGNNKVRTYAFDGQRLTEGAAIPVPGFPIGLAVSPDGSTLFAAQNQAGAVALIDTATARVTSFSVGACDGVQPSAAASLQCQPYGVALSRDGAKAYVSNWGEHSVSVLDARTGALAGRIAVGTHPNALAANRAPGGHELYVANGVIDTATGAVAQTLDLAPYRGAPEGSNPNALAVAPDGRTLYVANAGNNDVDVVALGTRGRIVGMIPTAWYPTGIDVAPDGRTLYVENAKGLGAGPNDADGPNPTRSGSTPSSQYVASMMHGTLSIVPVPRADQLERYTRQVVRNNGFDERDKARLPDGAAAGGVIPRRVGEASPITHVIYVVKENRTYDQVLGSLGRGNGDASLNLFGDDSAPNIRELARRFVTLDNFYANAEVSADGWNWSTAGTANTYVQKTFTENYSSPNRGRGYDFEGGNYATAPGRDPQDSYIWDRLRDGGVSFRNYGFWTTGTVPATPAITAPALAATTDPEYPGYNLAITDQQRMDEWEREFRAHDGAGAAAQRPHVGNAGGRADAEGVRGRQRLRAGPPGAGRLPLAVLEEHRDLRDGGRRAERSGPRGRTPDGGAGHQPVHADGPRRLDVLQHGVDAADDGADRRPAPDDAVRRGRHADAEQLRAACRGPALRRDRPLPVADGGQRRVGAAGRPVGRHELRRGGRGRRARAERGGLAERARRRQRHARAPLVAPLGARRL